MSTAVWSGSRLELNSVADTAFKAATRFWFAVMVVGQSIFAFAQQAQHILMQGITGDGSLLWRLGALGWLGTVRLPQGSSSFRECWLNVGDVFVRGPIQSEGQSNLFKFPIIFASSDTYRADGLPKSVGAE